MGALSFGFILHSLLQASPSYLREAKVAWSLDTTWPLTPLGYTVPYLPINSIFFGRNCIEERGRDGTLQGQLAHPLMFYPSQSTPWSCAAPPLSAHSPCPSSLAPQETENGDTLCGCHTGPVLPTRVPLPWGHTLGCVNTEKTDFILGCSVSTTLFSSIYY